MSKLKKDPNKQHYFSQLEKGEQDSLLERLANSHSSIVLWKKGQEETDVEEFALESYDANLKKLFLKPASMLKKLFKSHLVNNNVLLKIMDGRLNYFSQSTLLVKETTPVEYSIQMLAPIFMSQQRQNYRLQASTNVIIQAKFDEIVFPCLDISAGGFSLNIDRSKMGLFILDSIIKNINLRLNSYKWIIPSIKVVKIWDEMDKNGKPLPEVKVGISFHQLPKGLEEDITKAVNTEARGEEVRKHFDLNKKNRIETKDEEKI